MSSPDIIDSEINFYEDHLFDYKDKFNSEIINLEEINFIKRIYNRDHTLWSDNPKEITNRLGWLNSPTDFLPKVSEIIDFTNRVIQEGIENILLLGMGGSSLCADVFKDVFRVKQGYPDMFVVDSTDPDFLYDLKANIDFTKTLFLVSTKSGSTVETISFLKYFYHELKNDNRITEPGNHFVAITDPSSELTRIADEYNFRKQFINNPDIGGRFSVLSYFGLVPAALIGIDIKKLLLTAAAYSNELININPSGYSSNSVIRFGAIMGVLSEYGKDKLTLFLSEKYKSFGYWIEQLIAESSGKEGKGILPVLDQNEFNSDHLKDDRYFVFIQDENDTITENRIKWLQKNKFPYVVIGLKDVYGLGAEFFRFELAISLAGSIMKINPFDQPDVESAKLFTREFLKSYESSRNIDLFGAVFKAGDIEFRSNCDIKSSSQLTELMKSNKYSYISIQAYLNPNRENTILLTTLRNKIENISNLPVTNGLGPRFLHSTGQLHKGDSGKGFFIQIITRNLNDIPIPDKINSDDSDLSFGVLKKAQAVGDLKALDSKKRDVMTAFISEDVASGLKSFIKIFN